MAQRSTTPKPISRAAQKAAERGEEDLSKYLDKEPTDLQVRYSDWIVEKVGIEFGTAKEMDAFILGAQLSAALRMKFQASPENQAVLMESRSKPKKSAAKKPAKPAPEEEPDSDEELEEDEAPAPKPKRAATRRGAVKPGLEPEPEPEEDLEEDEEDDEPEEEPAPKPTRATARKRTGTTATAANAKPAPATTRRRGTTTKRASSAAPF